jgi:serine/threonine protein kinase
MINQQIQNYKILSLLGEGGMGTVYLAEHVKLGRKVAIKSLHAQFVNSEQIRARFIHEAKVMAQLQHPNIVNLYDYVETENGLYLIIELVDGKPIDEYIEQVSGPIEEEKAIAMMHEILEGFQYAHEMGLVHRDIKPSNLVITAKNKVKILDFGIAKMVGDTSSKMTKTGTQIGTVYYMSPEQVKGDDLDQRSDIYALGVTFFQMLTGSSPYKGMTKEFEVFMKIVNEDLPDPRTIYPGVSAHMCAIISKATARDVNARFQSCDEFIKGLKDTSIGHSYGISESVLENEIQHAKGNDEVKNVLDKPTSASKPQANKSGSEHSAENDKTRTAEYSQVLPSAKNKQFKTVGFIAAGVLLIGLLVYFLVPTEKQTNAKVIKEKEVLETTVVPIASAEQEAFDQLTKIRQRILAGESFESMARKYSMDSNVVTNGGFYSAKYGGMVKEIENMVEKLQIGELSPIFETQFGYNIIKVREKGASNFSIQLILLNVKSNSNLVKNDTSNAILNSKEEVKSTTNSIINAKEKDYFQYSFSNNCYEIFPYKFYIDNKRYYYDSKVKLKIGKHRIKEILYVDDKVYEEERIIYLDSKEFTIVFELNCG